jgi:hypothetical protein
MANDILEKRFIIEAFRRVSNKILCASLGESAGKAILFFLHAELGRDPSEMFWEDPKAAYQSMEKVLGIGTKALISILITRINQEYELTMDPKHFLNLMCDGSQGSVEEIRVFLRKIAELYRKRMKC